MCDFKVKFAGRVVCVVWVEFFKRFQILFNHAPAMNNSRPARRFRGTVGELQGAPRSCGSLAAIILAVLVVMAGRFPASHAADDAVASVTQIAAGTLLDGETVEGWTHRVLIAHPRIEAGDVDKVGNIIKDNAELFSFVVLARVERPRRDNPAAVVLSAPSPIDSDDTSPVDSDALAPADPGSPAPVEPSSPEPDTNASSPLPAVLADIGVGLATKVRGRLQVVSGPTAKPGSAAAANPAPDLGFISGQVLRTAGESLGEMRIVARRTTLVMYDSPAVIRIGDCNVEATVRALIWVEANSGRLHHMLWVMQRGRRQHWMPGLESGVYLKVPLVEDRVLHVDADRLTFGIPSATAIGLAKLPPGYRFSLAGELGDLACRTEYDERSLAQLATRLVAALRESNRPAE